MQKNARFGTAIRTYIPVTIFTTFSKNITLKRIPTKLQLLKFQHNTISFITTDSNEESINTLILAKQLNIADSTQVIRVLFMKMQSTETKFTHTKFQNLILFLSGCLKLSTFPKKTKHHWNKDRFYKNKTVIFFLFKCNVNQPSFNSLMYARRQELHVFTSRKKHLDSHQVHQYTSPHPRDE